VKRFYTFLLALFIFTNCPSIFDAAGQTVISTNTYLPNSPSLLWNALVNIRPGNGEVVTMNPPLFSWFYSPQPPPCAPLDLNVYQFQFQADYDGTFANPVVNVTTWFNFYNYLAPFTNSTVYWRVGYLTNAAQQTPTSGPLTNGWRITVWITNSFTIARNATVWDRSMLADSNYMAAHGVHPYLGFNANNRAQVAQFVQTNDPNSWGYASNAAYQAITSSWWINSNEWANIASPNAGAWDIDIATVAFVWQMTQNPMWTNGLVANFSREVNYFNAAQQYKYDYSLDPNTSGNWQPWTIGFSYDWLYSLLPGQVKSNVLTGLDQLWTGMRYGGFWESGGSQEDVFPFLPPFYVNSSSLGKYSTSHYYIAGTFLFLPALATYNDDPLAKQTFDLVLNYMMAIKSPWGQQAAINSGRGYGYEDTMNSDITAEIIRAQIAFPECTFNSDPFWSNHADWWMRIMPPGYNQMHEPWGDGSIYGMNSAWTYPAYSDLASFSRNASAMVTCSNEIRLIGPYSYANGFWNLANHYYFPVPVSQSNAPLAVCYPQDGWAFGSTYPPNTTNCFYNGVGFGFLARPSSGWSHGKHNQDMNYEIWAYGANITDCIGGAGGANGANYATGCSWEYNTIAINGLGECDSDDGTDVPNYARIVAFTNAPDYVYVAADGTYLYPHVPWVQVYGDTEPTGWFPPQYQSLLANGTVLSSVTKVQRHILFVHHQYFVIYDDLAASTNVNWDWVYHVKNGPVNNLTSGGSFNYTANVMGLNPLQQMANQISVYVFEVVNPSLLTTTNMYGTNAYDNPITGEHYYSLVMSDSTLYPNDLTSNSIWVSNITPTNRFHFMTVIYPVPPGGAPPQITRLDDYTVAVTNGGQGDVISFDPQTTAPVTMLVNLPLLSTTDTVLPTPPAPTYTTYVSSSGGNSGGGNSGGGSSSVNASGLSAPTNLRVLTATRSNSFTPPAGYFAWWNPDTISQDNNTPVSTWTDNSPSAFIASQNLTSKQPLVEIQAQHGHNILYFANLNDLFVCSNFTFTGSSPLEVFLVFNEINSGGLSFTYFLGDNGYDQNGYYLVDGQGSYNAYYGINGVTSTSNPHQAWYEMTGLFNGANSQAWTNGMSAAAGPAPSPGVINGLDLGGRCGNSGVNCFFGDVLIYTNVLSDATRQAVESGLRAKYGF
jgi:hypothetical protein